MTVSLAFVVDALDDTGRGIISFIQNDTLIKRWTQFANALSRVPVSESDKWQKGRVQGILFNQLLKTNDVDSAVAEAGAILKVA